MYHVLERGLSLTKNDYNGVPLLRSDYEPVRVLHFHVRTPIVFSDGDVFMSEAYGEVVEEVLPVQVENGMAGVIENENDWGLRDILLSKDADGRALLPFHFSAIHLLRGKSSIQATGKSGAVSGWPCTG